MGTEKRVRRLLAGVGVAVGVSVAAVAARAQLVLDVGRQGGAVSSQALRVYEGVSNKGDFQEALNDAVSRSLRALPGADRMVRYRVREITGEQGGIRGTNTLRVAIEVTDGEGRVPPKEPGGDAPAEETGPIRAELRVTPPVVARTGSANLELLLRNTTNQPARLSFASGQQYDFEALRDGQVVWRWSTDRVFTQALTSTVIPANGLAAYRTSWNLKDSAGAPVPPGVYTIRGVLTTRGPGARPDAEAELRVR